MAISKRCYPLPKASLLNAINDMMELQKGREVFAHSAEGKLNFVTSMYGKEQENRFTVTETKDGCIVGLELCGGEAVKSSTIFALLESLTARFTGEKEIHLGGQEQ